MLVSEDFQYIQVHNGQPFATNGVLEPPAVGDGGGSQEMSRTGGRPWEASGGDGKSSRTVRETWDKVFASILPSLVFVP